MQRASKKDQEVDPKVEFAKTLSQPQEAYKTMLSNPSDKVVDNHPFETAEHYRAAVNMTSAELFDFEDVSQESVIKEFGKQFESLKDTRISKEVASIKEAFERDQITAKERDLLMSKLQKQGMCLSVAYQSFV